MIGKKICEAQGIIGPCQKHVSIKENPFHIPSPPDLRVPDGMYLLTHFDIIPFFPQRNPQSQGKYNIKPSKMYTASNDFVIQMENDKIVSVRFIPNDAIVKQYEIPPFPRKLYETDWNIIYNMVNPEGSCLPHVWQVEAWLGHTIREKCVICNRNRESFI